MVNSEPIDGHWGRWTSWGECNKECGGGEKRRTRVCDDPKPMNGGAVCEGESEQVVECLIKPCSLSEYSSLPYSAGDFPRMQQSFKTLGMLT